MIARVWHGRTNPEKAEAYFEYTKTNHLPAYKSVPGNLGVFILRRTEDRIAHFLVVSLWESMDAVRSFSGPDDMHPHYMKGDRDFLTECEPVVYHYDMYAEGMSGMSDFLQLPSPPSAAQ